MRVPPPLILVPTSERTSEGGGEAAVPALDRRLPAWRRALWRSLDVRPGSALVPAYERYTGVLWEWLAPETLPPAALRRLCEWVVVVSPTHGLLAAGEPCGPDPAGFCDRLADGPSVTAYWRARLPEVVASLAEGRTVWNLLPGHHLTAAGRPPGWTVRVERDGRVVSYDSKAVKGAVVRHLLVKGRSTPDALRGFECRGYSVADVHDGLVRLVMT